MNYHLDIALKDVIKEQAWLRSLFKNLEILVKVDSKMLYIDSQLA
jgi:hypothetical protein